MGNFQNVVVTYAGLQLINEAIAASGQVVIASAEVGSGYPVAIDPRTLTGLVQLVGAATETSANDQVLYQTTVRISVDSAFAPFTFQLNEIGIYAQIGTNAPVLFAYAFSPGQGDYITPDPGPYPVIYDYAILIQYESDSPVVATVTVTPQVQLHGATHRGNNIDPIGLADGTASGLLSSPPNDATKVLLGTVPQSWGKIPLHAPTHLDNGTDPIPVATTSRTGLLTKLSGNAGDVLTGVGAWGTGFFPGFVAEFAGSAAPTGWLLCDGSSYPTANYPALFAVIGYSYGGSGANFNVPDTRGRGTIGAGQGTGLTNRPLGSRGGEETHLLTTGELAAHNHNTVEPFHTHVLNEGAGHSHTVNETPHVHGATDGTGHAHTTAENPHTHGVNEAAHQHAAYFATNHDGGGSPTHPPDSLPQYGEAGPWAYDYGVSYGSGNIYQVEAWTSPILTGLGILPALTNLAINVAHVVINIAQAVTGISINNATTGATINSAKTGLSIANAGGNGAHNNLQPFIAITKIIKY